MYDINILKQELSTAKTSEHKLPNESSVIDRHWCHIAARFGVFVDEDHDKLLTLYWLPKLNKRPYKLRAIAYSSLCTTTELSRRLTSCLTAIKNNVVKYCETVYEKNGKIIFCFSRAVHTALSVKNQDPTWWNFLNLWMFSILINDLLNANC